MARPLIEVGLGIGHAVDAGDELEAAAHVGKGMREVFAGGFGEGRRLKES